MKLKWVRCALTDLCGNDSENPDTVVTNCCANDRIPEHVNTLSRAVRIMIQHPRLVGRSSHQTGREKNRHPPKIV